MAADEDDDDEAGTTRNGSLGDSRSAANRVGEGNDDRSLDRRAALGVRRELGGGRQVRGAFDWFRHHAPAMLEPVPVETEALRAGVEFVPLGVLFAIMPWNFP